jgi:hypothetical protein
VGQPLGKRGLLIDKNLHQPVPAAPVPVAAVTKPNYRPRVFICGSAHAGPGGWAADYIGPPNGLPRSSRIVPPSVHCPLLPLPAPYVLTRSRTNRMPLVADALIVLRPSCLRPPSPVFPHTMFSNSYLLRPRIAPSFALFCVQASTTALSSDLGNANSATFRYV